MNAHLPVNKQIKSLDDHELVARYRQTGNNVFVGELYERYTHLVYGVCMKYLEDREDSRDATVEIFVKLLDDLKKHEVENFRGWLYSVARNHCLMKFRKDKNRIENRPELQAELAVVMEWNENQHHNSDETGKQQILTMEEAIEQLPTEQKRCIELFYMQEKSYQQVMELTGFDFKQVKSYIQNGKRNLKNLINRQYEGG
ncbi:MAG: sigma-70 family RNA polymerase sigma factor [Chitinophagales bacterium]|nr:sigma-70 family RNA polymerase sigma factor [Chitinophagales bacterium]